MDEDVPTPPRTTTSDRGRQLPRRSDKDASDTPLDDLANLFNPCTGRKDTSPNASNKPDTLESSTDDAAFSAPRHRRKLRPRHGLRNPKRYQT